MLRSASSSNPFCPQIHKSIELTLRLQTMILKCTKCGRLHDVVEWKPDLSCSCSADQPTLMLADQDEKSTSLSSSDDKTTPLTQSGSPTVQDDEVTVSLGAARGM